MGVKSKIVVFGGSEGGKNYCKFQKEYEILAIVDNDNKKHGAYIDGYLITAPENIKDYKYDFIVIASVFLSQIQHQLLNEFNISPQKIKVAPKGLLKPAFQPFKDEKTMKLAKKSLLELSTMFAKENIKYFIDFGTLLGIARDGNLITWDDDIDLSILIEDYEKVKDFLKNNIKSYETYLKTKCQVYVLQNKLTNKPINIGISFETKTPNVIRSFEISISIVTIKGDQAIQSMNRSPKYHFEKQQEIEFCGVKLCAPYDYESYLRFTYGDWKTPRKNMTFEDYPDAYMDPIIPYKEILY